MTRSKTLLVALALTLPIPVAVAGCGGDEGSDEDPAALIEAAFNNDERIESGVIDLSVEVLAEGDAGGGFTASVTGPFAADPEDPNMIGQLDLDITASGEGAAGAALPEDFTAGVTITEDNLYVNYNDTDYELGEEAFTALKEQQEAAAGETEGDTPLSFKEGCEQALEAQGADVAACDIDFTAWFSALENEGTEDVGGSDANHISGSLDVEQVVQDLFGFVSAVPGATGGVDPSIIEPQLGVVSDAISAAEFDIYTATEDDTIRGLDLALELDTAALGGGAAGVDSASLGFSFEISDVGEEQSFEAPSDPQPIEDLAGGLGLPGGIPGAELPGGSGEIPEIPGGAELPGGGGDVGKLQECIEKAAGDPAEIDKCLQ